MNEQHFADELAKRKFFSGDETIEFKFTNETIGKAARKLVIIENGTEHNCFMS